MGAMPMPIHAAVAPKSAERRDAVLLYAELRGFARMSDLLDPPLVLLLASDFFALAAGAASANGGELVSLHNDTALVIFAGGRPSQCAPQAVLAAQHIQRESGALVEKWRNAYGLRVAVSQGLHLGETVLGQAGPRGLEQRIALGDSVTLAHHLVRRARAGEIVVSDAVMGALSVENLDLDAEPLPALEIGKRPPIRIYGVLLDERLDFTHQ
jgi:class 3 adenylate cyclase